MTNSRNFFMSKLDRSGLDSKSSCAATATVVSKSAMKVLIVGLTENVLSLYERMLQIFVAENPDVRPPRLS